MSERTDTSEPTADLEILARIARRGEKTQLRLWLRMLSSTKMISQEMRLGELSRRTMVTELRRHARLFLFP